MKEVFKNLSKKLIIYPSVEKIEDPTEKNVIHKILNPIPIRAIVTDLTFAKAQWAIPGIETEKSKEILVEKKHRKLLKQSYKIKVQGEEDDTYFGWRVNGQMQLRQEGDYIRLYIYTKG